MAFGRGFVTTLSKNRNTVSKRYLIITEPPCWPNTLEHQHGDQNILDMRKAKFSVGTASISET